ncbi:MAG: hypothetical protein A2075_17810 [Geobacteraceae bacterium GWC2_58_44]|nr:MAG: hypothetical protein A2075_17810 [Geobacteraceae bacterium GWC2_58_44]HBG08139.1 hypothetical protein [Geobacter sp.]
MLIDEAARAELLALSNSEAMRNDGAHVAANRHNPLLVDGEVSADRVMEFLTQYNDCLNHPIKPSRPFIETNMKL